MQKLNFFWNKQKIRKFYQKNFERERIVKEYRNFLVFISWLFNLESELKSPIESEKYEEDKNTLLGKTYHFLEIENNSVKSPISGKIIKFFPNKIAVLISNKKGLQIILRIQENEDNESSDFFETKLEEGNIVKEKDLIFKVKNIKKIKKITLYIPWQPLIIKEVKGMKIKYRNPWSNLKTKLHGDYY